MKNNENTTFTKPFYTYLVFFVYSVQLIRAFLFFNPSFDYLWYHLPLGLTHFNKTTVVLPELEGALFNGYPPLAHLVQGFLASNIALNLGNSINYLALVALIGLIFILRGKTFNYTLLLFSFSTIPVFVAQLPSGYIDGFSNLWLVAALVALYDKMKNGSNVKNNFTFSIGVIFSAFSKFQTWPIVAVLCIFFAITHVRQIGLNTKSFALLVMLAFSVTYWPLRNIVLFGNPTYPYGFKILNLNQKTTQHTFIVNNIQESQLYEGYQGLPKPILFLMSVFEVPRFLTIGSDVEPMQWTHEQWNIGETKNPNFRMGGWSFITILLLLITLFHAVLQGILKLYLLAPFLISLLIVAFTPQSYELRYFMFIPLFGCYLLIELFNIFSLRKQKATLAILLLSCLTVLSSRAFLPANFRSISDYITPEMRAFWKTQKTSSRKEPICLKVSGDKLLLWAGPDFNSVWVKRCE